MKKSQGLQDPFLNLLRKEQIPVSIFLVNGIKLQGHVEAFDQYVVVLKNAVSQMIYKHAISTVVPSRSVRIPTVVDSEAEEAAEKTPGQTPGQTLAQAPPEAGNS